MVHPPGHTTVIGGQVDPNWNNSVLAQRNYGYQHSHLLDFCSGLSGVASTISLNRRGLGAGRQVYKVHKVPLAIPTCVFRYPTRFKGIQYSNREGKRSRRHVP